MASLARLPLSLGACARSSPPSLLRLLRPAPPAPQLVAGVGAGSRGWGSAASAAPSPPPSPYARSLDASSLKGRHLDSLFSLTGAEIDTLLRIAAALKEAMGRRRQVYQPLVRGAWRVARGMWSVVECAARRGALRCSVRRLAVSGARAEVDGQ